MRKLPWAALGLITAVVACVNACGSETSDIPPPGSEDGGTAADTDASGGNGGGNNGGADGSTDDGGTTNDGSSNQDGGSLDGSMDPDARPICKDVGESCTSSLECCTTNCEGPAGAGKCAEPINDQCRPAGETCASATDCCTGSCLAGTCSDRQCIADNQPCNTGEECCGGTCTGGFCKALSTTCKISGNPCTTDNECCSKLCHAGVCSAAVSFCRQQGDVCAEAGDCCTGTCNKQSGDALGLCGPPPAAPGGTQCTPKGVVCGKVGDTVPECGGKCCSRVCAPGGAAPGFMVCQPPSGCSPTGELCRTDSDCCGWSGAPDPVIGPVFCSKKSDTQEFGRCENGGSCREAGSICKPGNEACAAENNCCARDGLPANYCNSNPDNCCRKDALGIPRCILDVTLDCTTPPPPGSTCATSADCCGKPCILNKCEGSCVSQGGVCTTHSDCCPGLPCVIPTGRSTGICGGTLLPDGGVSDAGPPPSDAGAGDPDSGSGGSDGGSGGACALYGQSCETLSCCDGVPCIEQVCRYP